MNNFIRITPFMHVRDLNAAVHFFVDILGFTRHPLPMDNYAYVWRETAAFRILQNEDAPIGNRAFAYYIDVEDVEAIYAELKPKLDTLPEKDVHGPADKPYGQRELLVLAQRLPIHRRGIDLDPHRGGHGQRRDRAAPRRTARRTWLIWDGTNTART